MATPSPRLTQHCRHYQPPVGIYPISPTLVDPTPGSGNYTVTLNNGTLTINQALLSVAATNTSRLYGDPNPVFIGTIFGLKNGDPITATFTSVATAGSSVGQYAIVPALQDPAAKLSNYIPTITNGVLSVNPAPLSAVAAAVSRVYGDPNPAFTGTVTGLKNGDVITATFASAASATSPVALSDRGHTERSGIKTCQLRSKFQQRNSHGNAGTVDSYRRKCQTVVYGDPNPPFTALSPD